MRQSTASLCLLLSLLLPAPAFADQKLEGIACRSVHLQYPGPEGVAFYNEVTVEQSAHGTYFMACGFGKGYFGMQELGDGKKVVLFSVWDPGQQNDPKAVASDRQVKIIDQGEGVRVKRFGGEGTGAQSFLDYDWKIGETCRFFVKATIDGDHTAYAAYFSTAEAQEWKHLATFSTFSGKPMHGFYSFVEDFRRNRVSATEVRRARFGNGWVQKADHQWVALTRARFTADSNPVTNIDAGTESAEFFLATGGNTTNDHTKLDETIDRPAPALLDLPVH
jgi:hypothetical protein